MLPLRAQDFDTASGGDVEPVVIVDGHSVRERLDPAEAVVPGAAALERTKVAPVFDEAIGSDIQIRLDANQGSLYPALQRLEHRGDIASEWRSTENNRRARYYTITRQGRRALGQEVDRWHRFAAAIGLVLEGRS